MAVVRRLAILRSADDSGAVIAARPEYYGLLLFALAGSGTLLKPSSRWAVSMPRLTLLGLRAEA